MTRRFLLLALLPCLAILGACSGTFSFLVPKAAIVKAVTGQFPTVKSQGVLNLQILNPVLDFQGSKNRLGIQADAIVSLGLPGGLSSGLSSLTGGAKTTYKGRISIDGTLAYAPTTGVFSYSDVKVRKFEIADLPRTQLDAVTAMVTGMALNTLGGLQVYKLDQSDWKGRLAKGVLRGIQVTDDGVLVKFGL